MSIFKSWLVLALLPVLMAPCLALASAPPAETDRILARDINAFSLALHRRLVTDPTANLVSSPLSVSGCLGLALAGAGGATRSALLDTLSPGLDAARFTAAMAGLNARLMEAGNENEQKLRVANAIWPARDVKLRPEYVGIVEPVVGGEVTGLDYCRPEAARNTINSWVARATEGLITDLIPEGAVNCSTRLVLTNAIYFLGKWQTRFNKKFTEPTDFHTANGRTVRPQTMKKSLKLAYFEDYLCRTVLLHYRGGQMSMAILLPRDDNGLERLERELCPDSLAMRTTSARVRRVNLELPRFNFATSASLNRPLIDLGLKPAFEPGADFSGISANADFFIGRVVHQAVIKVDEKGTEAAAATGVIAVTAARLPEPPPVDFKVDHPFLFVIRDNLTGAVLFIGRVTDPTAD